MSNRPAEPTFWDYVSPLWLLRVRPGDFASPDENAGQETGFSCPGPLFIPGCMMLIVFHAMTLGAFVAELIFEGYRSFLLLYLAPLLPLWFFCLVADVKFRLQGSTSEQRRDLDHAFINWFGLISLIPGWLMAIGMFLWFLWKAVNVLLG